jgi:pyruvate dehydrogenase E2 component (dihydrolipoamide acetyltransferase)
MATEVLIPKLGMTMTEGTVAEWHVTDGAEVKQGEPIYRLETEKIEMEIEAEASGIVRLVAAEGATLECGQVVAYILAPGEALPSGQAAAGSAAAAATPAAAAPAPQAPAASTQPSAGDGRVAATPAARRVAQERGIDISLVTGTGPGGRVTEEDVKNFVPAEAPAAAAPPTATAAGEVVASPVARKLAESLGVDLQRVRGTGPGGRITREDVEAAAAGTAASAAAPAPAAPPAASAPAAPPAASAPAAPPVAAGPQRRPGETVPIRGIRKVIFQRMHASLQEMAQLTLAMEVWMDEAVKLRTQLIVEWEPEGVRPSYTDFVIKAVAKALRRHPTMNSEARGNEIYLHPDVHVGMAVALDEGLVVPVVRDADVISLKDLAQETSRLAAAARAGTLGPDDYAGGTFSVTTLGMYGVDMFTPIINSPNVGILGVGRIHDGIAWEGDRPIKRQQMTLSLTWDHRVIDGAPAAEFVQTVKALLESPYRLLV